MPIKTPTKKTPVSRIEPVTPAYLALEVRELVELCPLREGFLMLESLLASLSLLHASLTLTVKGERSVEPGGMKSLKPNTSTQ